VLAVRLNFPIPSCATILFTVCLRTTEEVLAPSMHKDDLPRLKLSSIEQPVDRVVTGFTAPALRAKID